MLEDFEGVYVNASGYGDITNGWVVSGSTNVEFSKSGTAHDGAFSLHALATYRPEDYTLLERRFTGKPGDILDLQVQIKANTNGEAQAALEAVISDEESLSSTYYWYDSSPSDWQELTLEDVEVKSGGEILVYLKVAHTTEYGSTNFYLDCLTASKQLTPASSTPATPTYDASGTWDYETYDTWSDCPSGAYPTETGTITITQTGNTFTDGEDEGTINGSTYTVTKEYLENDGTVTNVTTVTLTSDNSGEGTVNWTWTNGIDSCEGGHKFSLTKQAQATYNATGTWDFSEFDVWNDCEPPEPPETGTLTITQTGNEVTIVKDNELTLKGTVTGKTYKVSGTYYSDECDCDVEVEAEITLTSDTSGSGTVTWTADDGNSVCRGGLDLSIDKQPPPPGGDGGSGGGCFVSTVVFNPVTVPNGIVMLLLFGSCIIGFVKFRKKSKE